MSSGNVVVVGAGFAGMAAAALLARDGYDVTVIEKNDRPGGRAMVYEEAGYSFDMGPSWYMMLEAFERFFAEFGKTPDDFYETVRLDPSYRVFFSQDDVVDVHADLGRNLTLFNELEENGAKKLQAFLDKSREQYEIAINNLIYRDYDSPTDVLNKTIIFEGARLNIYKNLDKYTRQFFDSEKARKLIEYSIAFVGGAPHISPALYALLTHTDLELGIWYPVGGFGKVARSLQQLCLDQGVEFAFNQEVKKVQVTDGKANGVVTETDFYGADVVLNTADYHHAETALLDGDYQTYPESYWEKKVLAPSSFRIFLGLDTKLDQIAHHSLYLNPDWNAYFNQVYGPEPAWPDDPSYYICCPSKNDPGLAPEGGEAMSILVLIAPGLEDTPAIREHYYEKIMDHFEWLIGVDVRSHIVVKKLFSVNDFIGRYNAYKGTALGMAHTLRQTAVFRPRHQSKEVENLYYAGHYTHPGIGVPVTLISAQLATRKIIGE